MRPPSIPARPGYSLVELLVALAIVTVLIGLLLPAIHKVRMRAARTVDESNLRQIALAAHAYEAQHRQLPPLADQKNYVITLKGWEPGSAWYVPAPMFLVPYLGGADTATLYGQPVPGYPATAVQFCNLVMPVYVSPSDATHDDSKVRIWTAPSMAPAAVCNYAFNAYAFGDGKVQHGPPGTMWQMVERRAPLSSAFPDGTSQTLLLATKRGECGATVFRSAFDSKTRLGGSHLDATLIPTGDYFPYSRWVESGEQRPWTESTQHAAVFGHIVPTAEGLGPTFQDMPSESECMPDLAQGFHRGRITVAMADGSVRAVGAGIAPKLWRAGVLPNDGAGLPGE